MSQQVNLLLPELRPQRDWLAFPRGCGGKPSRSSWGIARDGRLGSATGCRSGRPADRGEAELARLRQRIQTLGPGARSASSSPAGGSRRLSKG